jgi:hypothetical protein
VTRKRHNLVEVVEPGPKARDQAEAIRERLLAEVAERRYPRTSATVDQLVERYLDQFDGAPSTLALYQAYHRNHITPLLGRVKARALDAEMLDSFYAECRRCRRHCTNRGPVAQVQGVASPVRPGRRRPAMHRVRGEGNHVPAGPAADTSAS